MAAYNSWRLELKTQKIFSSLMFLCHFIKNQHAWPWIKISKYIQSIQVEMRQEPILTSTKENKHVFEKEVLPYQTPLKFSYGFNKWERKSLVCVKAFVNVFSLQKDDGLS